MLTLTKAITYADLNATFRKGLRNGNWRKLKFLDKALFRAAMGFAKGGKSIVNGLLVEKLLGLVEKCERASQLKEWLKEPDYIFWLGTVR
uniref:Uncharacterized protein n=1 Tax=Candidatus Methanophagaceae archaeon ANME-1 ERB6 TaxID=2759912 RepID=A0A7G9YVY2_9EURY|nr:hypothetical protein MDNCFBIC_00037 [Methanosarcinales archaeon ANME-1 ERB6]